MEKNMEQEFDGLTIQEMDGLIDELKVVLDDIAELKIREKALSEARLSLEGKLLGYLQHFKKDKYIGKDLQIAVRSHWSWRFPQDPVGKEAFFNYMIERDGLAAYQGFRKMDSRTFNTYCKEKLEEARLKQDIDFHIPGVDEPTYGETLSVRVNK
jgi:hypothetical protein